MENNYYTVFLPTDKKIKIGYRAFSDKAFLTSIIDKEYLKELKLHYDPNTYCLAKIYLCHKDIKIGDQVTALHHRENKFKIGKIYKIENRIIEIQTETGIFKSINTDTHKIIGEILATPTKDFVEGPISENLKNHLLIKYE